MSMDGEAKTVLQSTSLTAPYGLTLDYDSQTLYWADYNLNKIEKSNADGSNRQLVATSLISRPYSITFYNERLYWTDLYYSRILTVSANSSSTSYLTTSFGSMYGIKAVAEERQPTGGAYSTIVVIAIMLILLYSAKSLCNEWWKLQTFLLIELNIRNRISVRLPTGNDQWRIQGWA